MAALGLLVVVASFTAHASATKLMQMLSPLPDKFTRPSKDWNGLPNGYRFDPFVDMEHTDDRVGTNDPWSAEVC